MSEYTPTTGNVRSVYAYGGAGQSEDRRRKQFDHWLAAHDRAVKAEAWETFCRDAATVGYLGRANAQKLIERNPYAEEGQ